MSGSTLKNDVENPGSLTADKALKNDPFSERKSKSLKWTNVKMTVAAGKKKSRTHYLIQCMG